jgi:hypothetical protein
MFSCNNKSHKNKNYIEKEFIVEKSELISKNVIILLGFFIENVFIITMEQ